MATETTYYLNGPDLSSSTAVYTDANMNQCAPDGFYSNGSIVREQVNCVLLPQQNCPSCAVPCGDIAGFSDTGVNGTFLAQVGVGADLGAVIIYSVVGNSIPDGVLVTFDGQTFNQLTFQGNNGDPIGLNSTPGEPTYYGSNINTPVTTPDLPVYTIQTDGSYIQSNLPNQAVNVNSNNVDLRGGGGATVYTQVIPKGTAVSTMNIDYFGPIQGTFFQYEAFCPGPLAPFQGSAVRNDTDCDSVVNNYFYAPNATATFDPNTGLVTSFNPDTNTLPEVGNYVFFDDTGAGAINPSATPQFVILNNSTYIEIVHGIVVSTGACTNPPLPCAGNLNPPQGQQGHYTIELDAGSTVNDTGAVIIYFDPIGVPDGIRVEYDGVYYNTLSTPGLGYRESQSSDPAAFTLLGDPNDNCWQPRIGTFSYTRSILTPQNTWGPNTPNSGNYTLSGADNQTNALTMSVDNMMVIPKPNATPNIVTIEVLGPCPTGWNIQVNCPAHLPSFNSTVGQGDSTCSTDFTQQFFFAQFNGVQNTYPELHNFVFEDQDGVTPLPQGFYIMDNNDFIEVSSNGIVIATGNCT